MSQGCSRRRIPVVARRTRQGNLSQSPLRRSASSWRRSEKPAGVMERFASEPSLWTLSSRGCNDEDHQRKPDDDQGDVNVVPFPSKTCSDLFSDYSSFSSYSSPSPRKSSEEFYGKDSKVVVNVTVEGSPGPIRTMVKLGSSVDETIRLVITKYSQEGRTPKLDCKATSSYELHHSHFSLQCLEKSELIGEVGTRSFYMRRNGHRVCSSTEIGHTKQQPTLPSPMLGSFLLSPAFICRTLYKFARKTCKLWRILGCLQA